MTRHWSILALPDDATGMSAASDRITALVVALREAFSSATEVRLMWELLRDDESIARAALQFSVVPGLFDSVFNSVGGYRGMYRLGPWIGSSVNALICREICAALAKQLPSKFPAWVMKWGPVLNGKVEVEKAAFIGSLDPALSKLWYATTAISTNGQLRGLPYGITAETIDAGRSHPWKVLAQGTGEAYFEVKGAFAGPHGLFQQKSPEVRALGLSQSGQA